jgi:hypothetical protein
LGIFSLKKGETDTKIFCAKFDYEDKYVAAGYKYIYRKLVKTDKFEYSILIPVT